MSDGDTLTVRDARNQQFKIRLSGIDTPKRRQQFDSHSRESLSEMVFNKHVIVESNKEDWYGRKVGKVRR